MYVCYCTTKHNCDVYNLCNEYNSTDIDIDMCIPRAVSIVALRILMKLATIIIILMIVLIVILMFTVMIVVMMAVTRNNNSTDDSSTNCTKDSSTMIAVI